MIAKTKGTEDMKIILLSIIFIALLFTGCTRHMTEYVIADSEKVLESGTVAYDEIIDDGKSPIEKLQISLSIWNRLKDSRGLSYQYTRPNISSWGGQKSETIIVVYDDFVKNRYYHEINGDNEITIAWREEGFDALNNHTGGAPVKRMDVLYEDCQNILANHSDVNLAFDARGVLSQCTYGKRGIRVENLFFLAH